MTQTVTTANSEKQNSPRSKKQIFIGPLISIVTMLLCLGGVEAAGYFWEQSTAQGDLGWTLVASRRIEFEQHGSADEPYHLFKPNGAYNWEDTPVEINSRGLRTEEFAVPKPGNTYRVLNLGDSIAFGWEVKQAETYGKLLEQQLRAEGGTVEVINAGIPTWNLEAERNFLLQEGLSYQPDLIILDLTLVNDIYGRGPAISQEQSATQWLRDNTYGWPFLTTQARFLMARQSGPEAIPVLNPPQNASAYFPTEADSPVWDRVWKRIAEMQQSAQALDIPFVMIAFPTAFQLSAAQHSDLAQQMFAERAENAGIPFVDLLPVYAQACQEAPIENPCEGYENYLFADVWMHPNPLGHQLAAEALLPIVQEYR